MLHEATAANIHRAIRHYSDVRADFARNCDVAYNDARRALVELDELLLDRNALTTADGLAKVRAVVTRVQTASERFAFIIVARANCATCVAETEDDLARSEAFGRLTERVALALGVVGKKAG